MMATQKFRKLAKNPHGSGRKRATGKKHKKHAAAAKAKASAKRNAAKRKKHKRNPLAAVGLVNSHKGGHSMAAKKKSKKKKSHRPKSNPFGFGKKKKGGKRRGKRNPSSFARSSVGMLSFRRPMDFVLAGLSILAGVAATRQLPQMLLKEKNTSWVGWLSNAATALGGGTLLSAWSKPVGVFFAAGGAGYTLSRVLTEQVSPIGRILSLSGVGDASAAGLGVIKERSFPVPAIYDDDGRLIIPQDYLDQVGAMLRSLPAPASASAPSGVAGLGLATSGAGRFASRFAA